MPHVLSIDIETSGPMYGDNVIVAIGGTVTEVESKKVVDSILLILPVPEVGDPLWNDKTWSEFWNNPRKENDGKTPHSFLLQLRDANETVDKTTAAVRLWTWIKCAYELFDDITVITDTVPYDLGWINFLLYEAKDVLRASFTDKVFNVENASGDYKPPRCTTSYKLGVARRSLLSSSNGILKELCTPEELASIPPHNHDPRSDAACIAHEALLIQSVTELHKSKMDKISSLLSSAALILNELIGVPPPVEDVTPSESETTKRKIDDLSA